MAAPTSFISTFKNRIGIPIYAAPFFWFLAFLLVIEGALSFLPENQFTRTALLRFDEVSHSKTPDILIFGDSVADGGLNDLALSAVGLPDGVTLANYSIAGTTSLAAYPLLKRQVQNGNIPKAIVLAYSARSYSVPLPEKHYGRFLNWGDLFEAAEMGLPLDEWIYSALSRQSFTIRYREELNMIVRGGGSGWDTFSPSLRPALGYEARLASLPSNIGEIKSRTATGLWRQTVFFNTDFHSPQYLTSSLDHFFELAQLHGIKVSFISMPIPDRIQLRKGFKENYIQFAQDLSKRHGLELLMVEPPILSADQFSDGVHLTKQAAFEFSSKVGAIVKNWVAEIQADPSRAAE